MENNNTPKNIVFFGVPGTGKTYKLQQLMKQYTETIQPLDSLKQFLENLSWQEIIYLIFRVELRLLTVTDIVHHEYIGKKVGAQTTIQSKTASVKRALHRYSNPHSNTIKKKNINYASTALFDQDETGSWFLLEQAKQYFEDTMQIFEQCSVDTSSPDVLRYTFVSFHQSYGYEEYIEGLKPVVNQQNQLTYQVQEGLFVSMCEKARADSHNRYAIFIDEINRANASKVFGELLSLIEVNKRSGMPNELSVRLAYSGKRFSVPSNLDIYATMNTADRSLTSLDSAMRRRFEFVEMLPDYQQLSADIQGVNIQEFLRCLNLRITAIIGADFQIGHTYFLQVASLKDLNNVMKTNIVPLLTDNCYNNLQQVNMILADNDKHESEQFIQINHEIQSLGLSGVATVFQVNKQIHALTAKSYEALYKQNT